MNVETKKDTDQQSSRRKTKNAAGPAGNVNEKAASARSEQAGQFLAWWKEYQKKMKSALRTRSGSMKLQMQS